MQTLFKHLLNRDVTSTDDITKIIELVNSDYRSAIVEIQNSQEYQSKVRSEISFIDLLYKYFVYYLSLGNGKLLAAIRSVGI